MSLNVSFGNLNTSRLNEASKWFSEFASTSIRKPQRSSSLPEGLVRTLGGLKLDGVFSLGFELAYDTTDIEAMRVGLGEVRMDGAP